jgi:hypothetical protein
VAGLLNRLLGWDRMDELASLLADIFAKHVKPAAATNPKVVDKAFSFVIAQALGEKRKGGWRPGNIARLSNTFGWKLVERGFPEKVALPLARKLAIGLAQRRDQKAPAASKRGRR